MSWEGRDFGEKPIQPARRTINGADVVTLGMTYREWLIGQVAPACFSGTRGGFAPREEAASVIRWVDALLDEMASEGER